MNSLLLSLMRKTKAAVTDSDLFKIMLLTHLLA